MSNVADKASGDSSRARRLAPLLIVAVVVADQLTKSWVVARYSESPFSIIGTTVEFRVARNSGGAFSMFTGSTVVLALLAIGLSVWLVRMLRHTSDTATAVALAMILGGALGNLGDRVFRAPGFLRGHVVDFVRVGSFPSFNVADSAITVGAALLILLSFRKVPDHG